MIAVCAIARDENRFIAEWLLHHLSIGFDRIYLYDNCSEASLSTEVERLGLGNWVQTTFWPNQPGQMSAYADFIATRSRDFEWVAFIDLDEFVIPKGVNRLSPILARFAKFSAVAVNWLAFGPSGHENRPSGLVLRNYQMRLPRLHPINRHVKSIVRGGDIVSRTDSPHVFVTTGDQCSVSAEKIDPNPLQDIAANPSLVLHHYITRSREDWDAKLRRGRATTRNPVNTYKESMFVEIEGGSVVRDRSGVFFADRIEPLWKFRYCKAGS